MLLNKNHLTIVEILLKDNISIEKLSHQLSISQRTLSNYINQIQVHFDDSISIHKQHNSISMIVLNEDDFFNIFKNLKVHISENLNEIGAREESIFYYLLNNGVCTIDDIAEDLFLSKSVVNNTLNEIKKNIKDYKVEIKGTQNVGLRIDGNEIEIRKVLIECFSNQYESVALPEVVSDTLLKIKDNFKLDKSTSERLSLAVKVTLTRLEEGYNIKESVQIDDRVFDSEDFNAVNDIKQYIVDHYEVQFPNLEILIIVFQIIGRRASIIDEMMTEQDQTILNQIIKNTIDDINFYYTIKIDDQLFSNDIQLHIKYLINRLIFDINIQNDLISEVKTRYPFAYELSKVLAENIEKALRIKVPLNELGFLSIYFSVYLQQLEQKFKEIHSIALITDLGLSSAKLVSVYLKNIFGSQIDIKVINENDVQLNELDQFDLTVSTIKSNRLFNRIIYIDDILDERSLKLKIEQFLIYKDVKNRNLFNQSIIVDFLNETDFHHIDKSVKYEEVIQHLSQELVEEGKVDSAFSQRILDRESCKPTITGLLGFPHTSHKLEGIWIKLAIIDEPLIDNEKVKVVVLVATPENEVNEAVLIRLYEEILAMTANSYIVDKISSDTDYVALAHILNKEMRS
nr:PRD domain-containing protein [Mammaliicoccus sp. Marseille-Q6498]